MTNLQSLSYYWPELILIVFILAALITDLCLEKSRSDIIGWVLAVGLIVTSVAIWNQDGAKTTLFTDMIVLDPFASFFKFLVILSTLFVIVVSLQNREMDEYRKGEYFILLGILVFGLFLMVSAVDIIMVYLSIEVVSIMSFILAGYLKLDTRSNEAGLKYVVYGAFSSGIMLFGLSILFGLAGSTNYFVIQQSLVVLDGSANAALVMALLMILAGFGYKISAVPFHFWTPDVYEGAPTTITAYLSVAPKAAGFAIIIRFFHQVFSDGGAFINTVSFSETTLPWPEIIGILAVITMTLGNLVAIQQKSIKRMLAYSSVAHAGYMMLALPVLSVQGVYAIMVYLVMYLFMNLGAFFVVIAIKNRTGGETFDDYRGMGWEMPFVGVIMTLFMLSLTGLPPTAGFIGKFYIFSALIEAGSQYYWLVLIGGLNSVISLYYYFNVVRVMFLKGERKETLVQPPEIMSGVLLVTAIPTILFGIYWTPVIEWVKGSLNFYVQTM